MPSNSSTIQDNDGDYSDWIELYNKGTIDVNLSGYGITDTKDNLFKWIFPDITIKSGDYLLIWASGKNSNNLNSLHTNFSISENGETIILSDSKGVLVDKIITAESFVDISYGRLSSGNFYRHFSPSTPGTLNDSIGYTGISESPQFSKNSGVYYSDFLLTLTVTDPQTEIIYTLDGSIPDPKNLNGTSYRYKNLYPNGEFFSDTFQSNKYQEPIHIQYSKTKDLSLTKKSSILDFNVFYNPDSSVYQGVVVKAVAIKKGALQSDIITNTYFIDPKRKYTLPVVSLSIQEDALFDYDKGIYTAGKDFDDWRNMFPTVFADGVSFANYHRDTEFPAHIEIFDNFQKRSFSQDIGLRIHGGFSRANAAKSLRLYARSEYGMSHLTYKFFTDEPFDAYKRILLRNSGNDWYYTLLRNASIQKIVRHLNFETQAESPSILFINGVYWGIHSFTERYDEHYFLRKYGIDPHNLDIMTADVTAGRMLVEHGDSIHYFETLRYIEQYGVTQSEHFNYIKTRIDIESFIDYQLAEIFVGNTDWPGNNVKCWRSKNEYDPSNSPEMDGRWRWMMYDTDFGLGATNHAKNSYTEDIITFATAVDVPSWPNPPWATFLFRKLLENNSFKNDFINRFNNQLNSAFRPEITQKIIKNLKKQLSPEIAEHIHRWNFPKNVAEWEENVNIMLRYVKERPAFQRNHIRNFFKLGEDYKIKIEVSDTTHGFVIVNKLALNSQTIGMPEMIYPWQGNFFKGLPVRIEAVPAPGYMFYSWVGDIDSLNSKITLTPANDINLKAIFVKLPERSLIHYWNFNNSLEDELTKITFSRNEGNLITVVPAGDNSIAILDTGNGFIGLNSQLGDSAGSHLVINNPINFQLVFTVPSSGYSHLLFEYETRRSALGPGIQNIEYSIDGINYINYKNVIIGNSDAVLNSIDFSNLKEVDNNPEFKIRISFKDGVGSNKGSISIDNITFKGLPEKNADIPPVVLNPISFQKLIEGDINTSINISNVFKDPNGKPLQFSVKSYKPDLLHVELKDQDLYMKPLKNGEVMVSITADDGNYVSHTSFRVLIFPKALNISALNFNFNSLDSLSLLDVFIPHILFIQNDSVSDQEIEFVYQPKVLRENLNDTTVHFNKVNNNFIINSLGTRGFSLSNGQEGLSQGGLLLALNTEGVTGDIIASWTNETLKYSRDTFGIKLQYRFNINEPFHDVKSDTLPVNYFNRETGHVEIYGPEILPLDLKNKKYIQLLWKFYSSTNNNGVSPEIRLDDIFVGTYPEKTSIAIIRENDTPKIFWEKVNKAKSYEFQVSSDSTFENIIFQNTSITNYFNVSDILHPAQNNYIRVRGNNELLSGVWSNKLELSERSIENLKNDRIAMECFPNIFDTKARLEITLPKDERIKIDIQDVKGKIHSVLFNAHLETGRHIFEIDGQKFLPGIYFVSCQSESGKLTNMKLVKY